MLIHVQNLHKSFNGVPVLRDINANIEKGEIISIIGPSGTGKSTFLRCLNLLERPDGGQILVDGTDILAPHADIPALRQQMGMVFQQFNLFPHLTVLENLTLAPRSLLPLSREASADRAIHLLDTVGLAHKADALPTELSGGQQQRVAIARALAMNPQILLLDEPTSALDPTMVNEVLAVIRDLAKTGITMLIVTHEMRFARDVSSRIFYMDEGIIYEDAPPAVLFDTPQRPKTRAFVRRLDLLEIPVARAEFDLYHFQAEVETFAEKQLLPRPHIRKLQLILEEAIVNLLLPKMDALRCEIAISEETRETEITFTWTSPDALTTDPLSDADESTEISRRILQKSCPQTKFTAAPSPSWNLVLPSPAR